MREFDAKIWGYIRGMKDYATVVDVVRQSLADDEKLWALFCDLTGQDTPSETEGVIAGVKRKMSDKERSPEDLASDGLAAYNLMLTTICQSFASALIGDKSSVLLTQEHIHSIINLGEVVGKTPEENRSEVDIYLLALIGAYLKKYEAKSSGAKG